MDSIGAELYKLVRKKDYKWADEQVTNIRMYWQAIYPSNVAAVSRSYINSQQSMEGVKKKFKPNTKFYKETKWDTLPLMFKIVNRLGELLMQAPPKCEVKADDPTALSGKQEDINILRTRKIYENGLNRANKTIGEPPSKLDLSKANSNLQDFDKLKMDDSDEEDLTTFEQFIQRMGYEIGAQEAINGTMNINKFDEFNLREAAIGFFATNAACYDVYVDELTGAQIIRFIEPEDARGIFGYRYDGRDDAAKGWEKSLPLRDFLGMVGNNFDMEKDWPDLIWAINGCNNTRFTGFQFADGNRDTWGAAPDSVFGGFHKQFGCDKSVLLPISQIYRYNVLGVKVEWYAPATVGTDYLQDRNTGTMQPTSISFENYKGDEKMFKAYDFKSEIRWVAYNAICLGFTLSTQKIYKWGEVYLQQPEGAYDEYSIGTLRYYRLPGITIGQVVQNYIDTANEAFFKVRWILAEAKPRAKQLVFNELIAMARALQTEKGGLTAKDGKVNNNSTAMLEEVFNFMEEHVSYDIRFYPQVLGKDIPQIPTLRSPDEGIDPLTTALQLIEQWAESQIMDKIGLYDMMNANPREGLGQQKMMNEMAKNQVGYIYRIFQYLKKDIATTLLCYTHDVIKYKQSMACKWLKVMLGDEKFEMLKNLGKYAPHRMGIFINDYYTQKRKEDIDKAAFAALEKMQITIPQYVEITGAEDYKLASKKLEIFLKQQEKKLRKQALQDQQIKGEQAKAADDRQMAILKFELEGKYKIEKEKADAMRYVADKGYAGKMDTTTLKQEHEPEKAGIKTTANKEVATHKSNLENQSAL